MRRFPNFLLLLIALWLPFQAAAAVGMPFCRHAHQEQPAGMTHEGMSCHEQTNEVAAPVADLGCDDCEMCHLATAGFLPVSDEPVTPPMVSVFVARLAATPKSFIADLPDQPPRR